MHSYKSCLQIHECYNFSLQYVAQFLKRISRRQLFSSVIVQNLDLTVPGRTELHLIKGAWKAPSEVWHFVVFVAVWVDFFLGSKCSILGWWRVMICTFVRCFISMIWIFFACDNPWRMMNLPLFKTFDRKFRNLLGLYCERHAFFPDHTCTREGEVGDKLWIMNSGPVMLQKKGFRVKMYSPGMHFGCDNMLGFLGCDGNVGFRVFYGKPLFFLRSWLLFLNFAMKSKYHASIPPVSCHCHNWVTGWLDHVFFFWTHKMKPKKTKVVKTVHGHNGGHDCLPCAFAFSLLGAASEIFFWEKTHWNPAVSSVTVTQMWDSTSSNLEMICRFLVFQAKFLSDWADVFWLSFFWGLPSVKVRYFLWKVSEKRSVLPTCAGAISIQECSSKVGEATKTWDRRAAGYAGPCGGPERPMMLGI